MSTSSVHGLVLGGEPRVQLLPPEVGALTKARAGRRLAGLLVVIAVFAVAIGFAVASVQNSSAQSALAAAQDESLSLLAQQKQYAKATAATKQVAEITTARDVTASTEVLWAKLVDQITERLPAGTSIDSLTVASRSPWEAPLAASGPLQKPRVATVTLVVISPTVSDGTALSRALETIPGYAGGAPETVTISDQAHTTITFDLGAKVLSGRFDAKGADK